MTKKWLSLLVVIIVLITSIIHSNPVVAAPVNEQGALTFTDLGLDSDLVLRGPYDSRDIRFALPPTWALQPGAELEIEASAFTTGNGAQVADNLFGAVLEVSYNEKLQQSIPLIIGEKKIYRVPIADASLVSPYDDGTHKLSFFLDAAVDCNLDFHDTTVIISVNSKANFPYTQAILSLDLKRLPWPIFQERGRIIDPVTVVLPASPTAEELQAGFVVMGAFGRMTNGKVPLTSITADQLDENILAQSHLLVVGKPSSFPMLSDLSFPVPITTGSFSSPEMNADDGILQILTSPWNTKRVLLMVSGNTDQAVVKAAQALSTSNIQTGDTPTYSIIAQVNPYPSAGLTGITPVSVTAADMTLADLGYTFTEVTGLGSNWISYEFTVPAGQMPSDEVYLDLNISTSSLVDPKRSEGVVYLNDVQIGSVALFSDTSNIANSRIKIPLSVIKSGLNRLDLVFNLLPTDECSLFTFADLWVTIYPDSVLHLPLAPAIEAPLSFTLRDMKSYPSPFTNDPSLGTTTFVLSEKDPHSWLMAGKIAFDLGTRVTNPVLGFRVAFDGKVPDDMKTSNLILVGEPKNLEIISQLNDAMPAQYENGSNTAVLESQQVIYRMSAEKSLGYLQLFVSPWNSQAAILGIFGTNPNGLGNAVASVLNPVTRGTLAGNFITLDGSQALVVDTRTGRGIGRISATLGQSIVKEEIINSPASSPIAPVNYNVTRQMVFSGILFVIALIAVTLIIILAMRLRKRRT